jgi:DNA polymerase-3 subunit epsilon
MRIVTIDTETTGLQSHDQVIEIGVTEIIDRAVGETRAWRVRPTVSIDPGAQKIHGISDMDLVAEREFLWVFPEVREWIGDSKDLIAHNSSFDMRMLDAECRRNNFVPVSSEYNVIDTLSMSRAKALTRNHKLDTLVAHFGIENLRDEFHGAGGDSRMLAHVYLKFTAGQESLFLNNDAPPASMPVLFPEPGRIERRVLMPSAVELQAHAEFCKANKIQVF